MGERVEVLAKFMRGTIWPIKFWRGNREYDIKKINLRYERKDGGKRFMCFAISTEQMEVSLDMCRDDFSWILRHDD